MIRLTRAQRLWHYWDWWKFEKFVQDRSLYFRRSDKLDDDMEGRFAEANRRYQTALWERFARHHSLAKDGKSDWEHREVMRHRYFINCWHMNFAESAQMWDLYTRGHESVVIRTTAHLLNLEMKPPAYQLVKVRYAGHDVPRPEFHSVAPFVYKDPKFAVEDEVRIVLAAPLAETIYLSDEKDFGRTLPVNPERIVMEIITHPRAPWQFRDKARAFCAEHFLTARFRKLCCRDLTFLDANASSALYRYPEPPRLVSAHFRWMLRRDG